ncbi:unnamed protein product, partial [Mesorhabditis spiculigera]
MLHRLCCKMGEPSNDDEKPRKRRGKNQPKEAKWRQQNLAAYRPVFNATTVFPWTCLLGIIFLGIGILLFVTNLNAKEIVIDYTNCRNPNGTDVNVFVKSNDSSTVEWMEPREYEKTECQFRINITEDFNGKVKFFYGLEGFYQNTRMYVKSRSDMQLSGSAKSLQDTGDCDPNDYDNSTGTPIVIAPCGKIADSMFNDTFRLVYSTRIPVPMTTRDMVHPEMRRKYKNPPMPIGSTNLCDAFKNTTKPLSWPTEVCKMFNESTEAGRGFENLDFQVWMEPSALPHFRKIYRLLDREADIFSDGLPKGEYTLTIQYNYPVEQLNINKTFIIAIETWTGPKNLFLPIAYITVGIILLAISAGLHPPRLLLSLLLEFFYPNQYVDPFCIRDRGLVHRVQAKLPKDTILPRPSEQLPLLCIGERKEYKTQLIRFSMYSGGVPIWRCLEWIPIRQASIIVWPTVKRKSNRALAQWTRKCWDSQNGFAWKEYDYSVAHDIVWLTDKAESRS